MDACAVNYNEDKVTSGASVTHEGKCDGDHEDGYNKSDNEGKGKSKGKSQ